MSDLLDVVKALQDTPIPVILVAAGIVFLFLALSGGIYGKIQIPMPRQKWAGILGVVLLVLGMALYMPGLLQRDTQEEPGSVADEDKRHRDLAVQEQLRQETEARQRHEAERLQLERELRAREEELSRQAEEQRLAEQAAQRRAERERLAEEEARRQEEQARLERLQREAEQQRSVVDLYVSEFSLTPEVPVQGEPVKVRIGIYNRGNKRAGPFTVQWWPGKNYPRPDREWHIDGMAARGGRILTHTYRGYPSWYGRLPTRVVIDPAGNSGDSSPDDNVFDVEIQVRKP